MFVSFEVRKTFTDGHWQVINHPWLGEDLQQPVFVTTAS